MLSAGPARLPSVGGANLRTRLCRMMLPAVDFGLVGAIRRIHPISLLCSRNPSALFISPFEPKMRCPVLRFCFSRLFLSQVGRLQASGAITTIGTIRQRTPAPTKLSDPIGFRRIQHIVDIRGRLGELLKHDDPRPMTKSLELCNPVSAMSEVHCSRSAKGTRAASAHISQLPGKRILEGIDEVSRRQTEARRVSSGFVG